MQTYTGSRDLAQLTLNIGTRCKWIVSFTPRPLYSPWKKAQCTWDKRPKGPRTSSDVLERNLLSPSGIEPRTVQSTVQCLCYFAGILFVFCGPGSSVGIATELLVGRSGDRIPVGRDFPPVQTGLGAHPASCTTGTGFFPGVEYGRSVLLTTHPLLVPRSWKSRVSLYLYPPSEPQPGL